MTITFLTSRRAAVLSALFCGMLYCGKLATVFGALSGKSSTTKSPSLVLNLTLGVVWAAVAPQ